MRQLTDTLVDPLLLSAALLLLAIAVLLWRSARRGQATLYQRTKGPLLLLLLLTGLMVFVASPAVVNPLVDRLESRFPASPDCAADPTPLVVLGGGVDSRTRTAGQIQYMSGPTLARVAEAQRLVRLQAALDYPVVLAGGGRGGASEAAVMGHFLQLVQVPEARLLIESESENTYFNAQNVARIFGQRQWIRKIRLITSALHMYRAHGVFSKLGFEVCTISVDQQALQDVPWYALLPQSSVLHKSDRLWHELAGIVYYRLRGWL